MTRIRIATLAAVLLAAPGTLLAQLGDNQGEVRKVDKERKRITIKHGRLPMLDMDPMTMVFQVRDPAMLERVKAGDKVRFEAEMGKGGAVIVTKIERAQ